MKKIILALVFVLLSCKEESKSLNESPVIETEDYRITTLRDEQSGINTLMNKIIVSSKEPDKSILITELIKKYPSKFRNIYLKEFNKTELSAFLKAMNENYKKEIQFQSLKIKQEKLQEKKQNIIDNVSFK